MNQKVFVKQGCGIVFAAVAVLLPFASAQAGGYGGQESTGMRDAGAQAQPGHDAGQAVQPSPLGFELPAATPRGVAGPLRADPFAEPAINPELRHLGGIGGSDTN